MDEKRIEAISLIRSMASKLKTYDDFTSAEQDAVEMAIDALKQKPVVKGEWIPHNIDILKKDGWYECSVCGVGEKLYNRGVRHSDVPYIDGQPYEIKKISNYCSNCGAKMNIRKLKYTDKDTLQGGLASAT